MASKGDSERLYDTDYENDPTILNENDLWRRIHRGQIIKDDNLGVWRPSSACFEDSSDGTPMSTHLASLVLNRGGDAATVLKGYENFYLVALTAGQVRDPSRGKQGVQHWPVPADESHTYVFGRKTDGVKKFFAKACAKWVIGPS